MYICCVTLYKDLTRACVLFVGLDEMKTTAVDVGVLGLCSEESVCPAGSRAQGLAGCDPLTHNCVCHLGFQLDNGVCVGLYVGHR